MMAKITKGRDFGGAVRYVTQDKKEAKILDSKGVLTTDRHSIINSFRLQSQLRPDVKVMVGHISLDFSKENVDKVDDNLMRKVADDYMRKMRIQNTQYILVRHFDREHPHCHIVFNRIDNNGHLISDKNDRVRNAKICKELTAKYSLHMAQGKDHVHRERLRGADAVKYQIYDALEAVVPRCKNWKELEAALKKQGISMAFTYRGTTTDIQGVTFEKDGLHFNGSKIDRKYSFSKISAVLSKNAKIANHQAQSGGRNSNGYQYQDERYYTGRRQSQSGENNAKHSQPTCSNGHLAGQSHHNNAASFIADVVEGTASAAVSITANVAGGFVGGIISAMGEPSVSPCNDCGGGVGTSNSNSDDEYYIDENGVRRRKRRGMSR
jgi:hypothetical protein